MKPPIASPEVKPQVFSTGYEYQRVPFYLERGLGLAQRPAYPSTSMDVGKLYRVTKHYVGDFAGELLSFVSTGVIYGYLCTFKVVLVETGELQPGATVEIDSGLAQFHVVKHIPMEEDFTIL